MRTYVTSRMEAYTEVTCVGAVFRSPNYITKINRPSSCLNLRHLFPVHGQLVDRKPELPYLPSSLLRRRGGQRRAAERCRTYRRQLGMILFWEGGAEDPQHMAHEVKQVMCRAWRSRNSCIVVRSIENASLRLG